MSRIQGTGAPQQQNQSTENKQANQKDSDDFSKQMEENKKKGGKNDKKAKKESPEDLMRSLHKKKGTEEKKSAEDLMSGMEGQGRGQFAGKEQTGVQQQANVQNVRSSDTANDMRQLADRISTAADAAKGTSEVKISMKNDFLPGTEISVKQVNGELKVNIVTNNPDAHQIMSAGAEQLMSNLKEKFGDNVNVDLQMEGDDQNPDDPDGRSRDQREYEEDEDDS